MSKCARCGSTNLIEKVLPEYKVPGLCIPTIIKDSAISHECKVCGEMKEVSIPDLAGLLAAVAVSRAMIPVKLVTSEIIFLRKSLDLTAKTFASLLEVTPETVLRWENGNVPISPSSEKLLRLLVGHMLGEQAIGIDFIPKQVIKMKVQSASDSSFKLEMVFERARFIHENKATEIKYTGVDKAA